MNETRADFQELISKGHSAAWDQSWSDAAEYYRQALELKPENMKAITSLGLALFEMREYKESLDYYLKAAEIDPQDPLPYEKITLIHERLGNPKRARDYALQAADAFIKNEDIHKAIENWNRAIDIDPHHVRAHARLALVYKRMGQVNKAISKFIHVASILQHSGQLHKAMDAVKRALSVSPESIKAVRAKEMLQQGKMLPLPERFQSLGAPEKREAKFELPQPDQTEVEDETGRDPIEEAVERAITVMAKSIFEESSFQKTKEDEESRNLDSFLEEEGEVLRKADNSLIKLHVSQAIEHIGEKAWKEAADELKQAVDDGYDHPSAFFMLGYIYLDLGRLESAERNLSRAVTGSGFDLSSRLLLAQNQIQKENWEEAAREYLEALRLADTRLASRGEVDDLVSLYEAMIDDLQSREGEEAYRELCDHVEQILLTPNWREVLREHREKSEDEEGGLLPAVDDLIADRKKQVMDNHREIQDLAEEGYYGAAMEKAFFALRNAPTYLPLHVTVGNLLLDQGQIEGAVAKYLAVADVYSVQGKTERALAMLTNVIDLEPMNVEVRKRYIGMLQDYGDREGAITEYNNLADVYYNLAELDHARRTYSRALELAEGWNGEVDWQKNILLRLADIDIQRLDWDAALETFQEIIANYPQDEEASINAVSLHYQVGNPRAARNEIDRYLSQYQEASHAEKIRYYLETLRDEKPRQVEIRKRLSSFYEAQGEKAQAIAELDALGDALLDEGRTEEVAEIIREIIALNPPNADDYQKLLDQLV